MWVPEKYPLLLCHLQLKHIEVAQGTKDWILIHFVLSDNTPCVHWALWLKDVFYTTSITEENMQKPAQYNQNKLKKNQVPRIAQMNYYCFILCYELLNLFL